MAFSIAIFGVIISSVITRIPVPWGQHASSIALWISLGVAGVAAFLISPNRGLLEFRLRDLPIGLAIGLILRVVSGWIDGADALPFPTDTLLDNGELMRWLLTYAVPAVLVGPVVEELFFRGVVAYTLWKVLGRTFGVYLAAALALFFSTVSFALLHAIFGTNLLSTEGLQLLMVGLVTGAIVLSSGRLWTAVIAHATYNLSFLVLAIAGAALS